MCRVAYRTRRGIRYEQDEVREVLDRETGITLVFPKHATLTQNSEPLTCIELDTCKLCGEDFEDDTEGNNGICNECFRKKLTVDDAFDYGASRTETVKVNGFLAWMLSTRQIEDILRKSFSPTLKDATSFCTDDAYDYADYLKEKDAK